MGPACPVKAALLPAAPRERTQVKAPTVAHAPWVRGSEPATSLFSTRQQRHVGSVVGSGREFEAEVAFRETRGREARTVRAPQPCRGQCRGLGGDRELPAWQRARPATSLGAPGGSRQPRQRSRFALAPRRAGHEVQRPPPVCVTGNVPPRPDCSRCSPKPEPGPALWPCPHDGANRLPAPAHLGALRRTGRTERAERILKSAFFRAIKYVLVFFPDSPLKPLPN